MARIAETTDFRLSAYHQSIWSKDRTLKNMVKDYLNEALLRRLEELGLPPSLIEVGDFREKFFLGRWVMFVRDRDQITDVHLVEPNRKIKSSIR